MIFLSVATLAPGRQFAIVAGFSSFTCLIAESPITRVCRTVCVSPSGQKIISDIIISDGVPGLLFITTLPHHHHSFILFPQLLWTICWWRANGGNALTTGSWLAMGFSRVQNQILNSVILASAYIYY